jgi:hypothetical protein
MGTGIVSPQAVCHNAKATASKAKMPGQLRAILQCRNQFARNSPLGKKSKMWRPLIDTGIICQYIGTCQLINT